MNRDSQSVEWCDVVALASVVPDTGVCALVYGVQLAIVRVGEDDVYCVGNLDPFSGAQVISRGIVGDAGGIPKISSPMYKQPFDLRTGQCLDDPSVRLPVWPARVRDGRIEIAWDHAALGDVAA